MNRIKNICGLLLTLSFALLLLSPVGYCSGISEQNQQQIRVSETDWQTLKSNNSKQNEILQQLNSQLQTASEALQASTQALTEAQSALQISNDRNQMLQQQSETLKIQLQESQSNLQESQKQTAALKNELTLQKQQTAQLQLQLQTLVTSANSAGNSIDQANKYLQDAKAEFEADVKAHQKTENSLRNQKTLWQILAGAAIIYAAGK